MLSKRFLNFVLAFALILSIAVAPFNLAAQEAAKPQATISASELDARLATIEKVLDEKRKSYGVPGMSLVIVKDDKIIYMKGLGFKDLEKSVPVTPDTLFAIGSATKAFTALAVLMSADDGKLSLDDSPKKLLPYFKMYDPEADTKITIRDLLSHSSGLNRTDLPFAVGTLNREEVIRVAGMAHPTAKFREKFQYQNAMFTVAGEVAGRAQGTTWEKLVKARILNPLGMKNSDLTVKTMLASRDFSYGYTYNTDTKKNRRVPMRDIPSAAPAGAINSSAREMAAWLRFMLNGGVYDGKRLISEKNFNEFVTTQTKISGKTSYGLGWFLRDWNGHKVIEHGGNIDGFNAQVAFMPDQKLGFVLLTNLTASRLGNDAMTAIWSNLGPNPDGAGSSQSKSTSTGEAAADPNMEVGTYRLVEANVNIDVAMEDGKLVLTVPGQPKYTLENIGGRRYKLVYPGLEGFFATFRAAKDKPGDSEVFMEQPGASYVLPKLKAGEKPKETEDTTKYDGPLKDLVGSYIMEGGKMTVELKPRNGNVLLVAPGQQPYTLVEKSKDEFALQPLPDTYKLNVKRDAAGKVTAIVSTQPEGAFTFNRDSSFAAPMPIDELMVKVIEASGGEVNIRKHTSMVTEIEIELIHQGISGKATIWAKAPNMQASDTTLLALGKKIGTTFEYFDGSAGGQETSFTPSDTLTGKQLANAKVSSDFYGLVNWKTLFKTVEIKRMAKVGEEDVYVVVMTPHEGTPVTLYISTKSFVPLRRETVVVASDSSGLELPISEEYSDYRSMGGMMIPAKVVTHTLPYGDIITKVVDVKFDVEIPDTTFRPRGKK
jgi:CubicO group peptidase (beta-lactamase class C family)